MSIFENMPLGIIQVPIDSEFQSRHDRLAEVSASGENAVAAFMELMEYQMQPFVRQAMTKHTEYGIRAAVDGAFREATVCRALLMFADGAVYVGATPVMKHERNRVDLRWKTDFFPGPRWVRQHGEAMPLGFFGEYDLYIGMQDPLPPTLIARYGNAPHEYSTHNPVLLCHPHEGQFMEAFQRAQALGLFVE